MLKGIDGKELISFGKNPENEWTARNINVPGGFHIEYDVYHGDEFITHIYLHIPGEHNVLNSLAAFIACIKSGADVEKRRTDYPISPAQGADLSLKAHTAALPWQTIMHITRGKLRLRLKRQ